MTIDESIRWLQENRARLCVDPFPGGYSVRVESISYAYVVTHPEPADGSLLENIANAIRLFQERNVGRCADPSAADQITTREQHCYSCGRTLVSQFDNFGRPLPGSPFGAPPHN